MTQRPSTRPIAAVGLLSIGLLSACARVEPVDPRDPFHYLTSGRSFTSQQALASAPASLAVRPGQHLVREGDTLYAIAARYSVDPRALAAANDLPVASAQLRAGLVLRLPEADEARRLTATQEPATDAAEEGVHVVVLGDDLASLATRYGVSTDLLARANGIDPDADLFIGQKLIVPVLLETSPSQADVDIAALNFPPSGERIVVEPLPGTVQENRDADSGPPPLLDLPPTLASQADTAVLALDGPPPFVPLPDERAREATPAEPFAPQPTPAEAAAIEADAATPAASAETVAPTEQGEREVAALSAPGEPNTAPTAPRRPTVEARLPTPSEQIPSRNDLPTASEGEQQASLPPSDSVPDGAQADDAIPAQQLGQLPGPPPLSGEGFIWPVQGKLLRLFDTSDLGRRSEGVSIAAVTGTPVLAAEDGVVAMAARNLVPGYGNMVVIRHAQGYLSAYAHNASMLVKAGDVVRRGEQIATVGKSGNVDAPQLRFELRRGRAPLDPMQHLVGTPPRLADG